MVTIYPLRSCFRVFIKGGKTERFQFNGLDINGTGTHAFDAYLRLLRRTYSDAANPCWYIGFSNMSLVRSITRAWLWKRAILENFASNHAFAKGTVTCIYTRV